MFSIYWFSYYLLCCEGLFKDLDVMSRTTRRQPKEKDVELKRLQGLKLRKKQRTKQQRQGSVELLKDIEFATRHKEKRNTNQLNVSMYSEEE